jgi:hypothetical protein
MIEAFLLDDTNEQTSNMIEKPQSIYPNPDITVNMLLNSFDKQLNFGVENGSIHICLPSSFV